MSDKWDLSTLRTACRVELSDPNSRFWGDAELNTYINDWQADLQSKYEFVYTTNTQILATNTATLPANALRLDRCFWNNKRLIPTTEQHLSATIDNWRSTPAGVPTDIYQPDNERVVLYPPVLTTGTLVLEYPAVLTLATAMEIPAWTRYSCIDYVAYNALLREGPANNPTRALRYKARYTEWLKLFTTMTAMFAANHAPQLRPASKYDHKL